MSKQIGDLGEKTAKIYLMQQGLQWVESNFACRMGEIDLIMLDGACLVFVEVRQRRTAIYGGALASVDRKKQIKLLQVAQYYQQARAVYKQHPCRIDVVAIDGEPQQITWIQNAITLT